MRPVLLPRTRLPNLRSLLKNLAKNPRDSNSLTAIDALLPRSKLLDSSSSLLLLRALSASRKLTRARTLISDLKNKGAIPNLFLFTIVLQCLLPDAPIKDVDSFWGEISSGSSNASEFITQLCQFSKDPHEIDLVFRRVSSSRFDLSREAYVALIGSICGRNKQNPSLAQEVLKEMDEKGFEVDSSTYFAVFQSFCRIGDVFGADSVLRGLVAKGDYELDVSIYGNFMHGLCISGKLKEARKLFDKLLKRDHGGLEAHKVPNLKMGRRAIFQLKPSNTMSKDDVFGAYFQALCNADKLEQVQSLAMEAMENNVVLESRAYRSFVRALFRANRVDDAFKLLEKKKIGGFVSYGDISNEVIERLCEMHRLDEAHELLLEMKNRGFVPNNQVLDCFLEEHLREGRVGKAMRFFEEMKGSFNACTCGVMVCGFVSNGDIQMALSIMEEMVRKKMTLSFDSYNAIVRGLCKCGRFEEAEEYVNRMVENGVLVSYAAWESLIEWMIMQACKNSG
ncbi:TPR-like protein [Dioscorea alata]|uniref:TPR-like protein n=1 Tax=Dioscorea alata TaxID=55571 RepID=A0ACB7V3M6_DIOAL|nr:TPR-like protein [Dioscorea alata]